jgi:hypothetical protein
MGYAGAMSEDVLRTEWAGWRGVRTQNLVPGARASTGDKDTGRSDHQKQRPHGNLPFFR